MDYSYARAGWVLTAAAYAKQERGLFDTGPLGVEVYVQRSFGTWLRADLAAASLHVRTSSVPLNGLFHTPIRRDLPFDFKSIWQVTTPWLNLGAAVQYRSGVPYTPVIGSTFDSQATAYRPLYPPTSNDSRLPTYFRVDFSANRLFKLGTHNSLLLYATLNNAFNTHSVSYYTYNADYSLASPEYFQLRSLYLGLMLGLK